MAIEYDKNTITIGAIQQYEELKTLLLIKSDEIKSVRNFCLEKVRTKKKKENQKKKELKRLTDKTIKLYEREIYKMLRTLKIRI